MPSKDITLGISSLVNSINKLLDDFQAEITEEFIAHSDNNQLASLMYDTNRSMARYLIMSVVQSMTKKHLDVCKKKLDTDCLALDKDIDGQANQTLTIYEDDLFEFTKRQNKDGSTTALNEVVTQLARVGVEKSLVDLALKKAEKPKKGNVYYQIIVKE